MSLRQALTKAVAGCMPLEMQHATSETVHATDAETSAQQHDDLPSKTGNQLATPIATSVQPRVKSSATGGGELHVAFASTCNTQPSALTAPRITAELLRYGEMVCDYYGDSPKAREDMREQCLELPIEAQADILNYFRKWTRSVGMW